MKQPNKLPNTIILRKKPPIPLASSLLVDAHGLYRSSVCTGHISGSRPSHCRVWVCTRQLLLASHHCYSRTCWCHSNIFFSCTSHSFHLFFCVLCLAPFVKFSPLIFNSSLFLPSGFLSSFSLRPYRRLRLAYSTLSLLLTLFMCAITPRSTALYWQIHLQAVLMGFARPDRQRANC